MSGRRSTPCSLGGRSTPTSDRRSDAASSGAEPGSLTTRNRLRSIDDEVLSWIAAGTPPIYFGFGSTPIASPADTLALISAASTLLGERALICAGPNDCTHVPHAEHVKIVEAVNHAAVFPACRAVVHHGGAGTLVLGVGLDQPVWAFAIERLKVGSARHFSATTQESLVADLRSILTPQCRSGQAANESCGTG
jgi:vancomycin aglycone glucosyltransferase